MRASSQLLALFLIVSSIGRTAPLLTVIYGETRRELEAADLAALPKVRCEASDHGTTHRYEGIAVRDILALLDAPFGEKLRGPACALVVSVHAADGYTAAFALAEFDPAFRPQDIILADMQDGAPLPDKAGPLRLVCPGDKRGARWVRQVVSLEILSLPAPSPR